MDEAQAAAASQPHPATEHDQKKYLPEKGRQGIALCLSGGGFRASLFHLGALRRLNELGVLSHVTTISSVSGGSILSAYFATQLSSGKYTWPEPGQSFTGDEWNSMMGCFLAFTARNLRTGPLLHRVIPPWNLFLNQGAAARALMESYRKRLTNLPIVGLPEHPNFVICATELSNGVNWIFTRDKVGDYRMGYMRPKPEWPLARAVAASSCFPPPFDPMELPPDFTPSRAKDDKQAEDETEPALKKPLGPPLLSDAGVYDNLGLEPVWKDHAIVLVSDGGATFDPDWQKGPLWRNLRNLAVATNQATAVRKRWLISSFYAGENDPHHTNPAGFLGTYWGIGTLAEHYAPKGGPAPKGYPKDLVDDIISEVRTDMDAFSEAERYVLENHGYLLADAAIHRWVPSLIASPNIPLSVPHPEWFQLKGINKKIRKAMANSSKICLPGRGWWRW